MRLIMAWGPQHRRSGPPRGLKNLGNTCYLNSVLQCLAHTPPLAQFCLASKHSSLCNNFVSRDKECGFCILERQIARLHTPATNGISPAVDTPSKLLKSLSIFAEHFKWGRQEDAHEFLRYVIDTCHTACVRVSKARSSIGHNSNNGAHDNSEMVMRDIFGGALLSQVKCMSCKGESNKTDEIMDLSLDLCQSNSLKDALARFFQPEILDGSNKYSCERCKKLSVAKKQMFVSQAPNVLVIQLKRFEGINGGKINRNIAFEEVLLLSSFMFSGNQGSQAEYNLFGSIVHAGFSPDSGHYYAYIKDASGNWYCCNDTQVSRSSAQEVLSEKVYILFYILRNANPKPNKPVRNGCVSAPSKPLYTKGKAPKSPVTKQNGSCNAKINGNGAPNPHSVKQIGPVKFEIKKPTSNGTRKSEVRDENNSVIKKGISPSNSSSPGESKSVNKVKSSSNGSSATSKGSVLREVQNNVEKCPGPRATCNGSPESIEPTVSVPDRENNSCRNGASEGAVFPTKESKCLTKKESSEKNASACILQSHQELQNLKNLLVSEASSELRSCGWTDEVQSYMHDRKRLCVRQGASNTIGAALREQLITESKRKFNSRIPESLKGKLYQRLISFSKDHPLLDS